MKGSARDNGVLEWSDPPPRGRPKSQPPAFLETLQAYPGRWALVEQGQLKDGRKHMPSVNRLKFWQLEVSVRKGLDGSYKLWARWPAEEPSAVPG